MRVLKWQDDLPFKASFDQAACPELVEGLRMTLKWKEHLPFEASFDQAACPELVEGFRITFQMTRR